MNYTQSPGSGLRTYADGRLAYRCPACDMPHSLPVDAGLEVGRPHWDFNGDHLAPTFHPSVLVTWEQRPAGAVNAPAASVGAVRRVCHCYVRGGRIQYLGDCTHAMAGQTVPLGDWPPDFD